jgi:beta-xylosidase
MEVFKEYAMDSQQQASKPRHQRGGHQEAARLADTWLIQSTAAEKYGADQYATLGNAKAKAYLNWKSYSTPFAHAPPG